MQEHIPYKGVIYMYTFPNGKVYIGQTRRDPKIRHKEHLDPIIGPTNSAFWSAYIEQGEPKYEILETWNNDSIDELKKRLDEREDYLISLYQATNPLKGYNLKTVGKSISSADLRLYRLTLYYQQVYLEEAEPLWNSVIEKLHDPETMNEEEKVFFQRCFGKKNAFGGFVQKKDVAKEEDFDNDGYDEDFWVEEAIEFARFILEEDMKIKAEDFVHENRVELLDNWIDEKTVFQLDEEGNIIAKYDTQLDAAHAIGRTNAVNINNVLNRKQQTAYGYRWVYAIDYYNKNEQ